MSVGNWSDSDKLIKSAVTAGSFMIIDKLYYKSPMGRPLFYFLSPFLFP